MLRTHSSQRADAAELQLAKRLHIVRQAKRQDVYKRSVRKSSRPEPVLLLRKLKPEEIEAWEAALGKSIWTDDSTSDSFIPAVAIKDDGARHIFPRIPYASAPVACLLCGAEADNKQELLGEHFRNVHCKDVEQGCSIERLEEEYRKRCFYYEEKDGPFVVSGQEVRRSNSAHARHQTHSYPGSTSINFDTPLLIGQSRGLGSCAICARSHWKEELLQLDLFVKPEEPTDCLLYTS